MWKELAFQATKAFINAGVMCEAITLPNHSWIQSLSTIMSSTQQPSLPEQKLDFFLKAGEDLTPAEGRDFAAFHICSTLHSHCLSNRLRRTFIGPCHFRAISDGPSGQSVGSPSESVGIHWKWLNSAASPGKVQWKSAQAT
jgi:hypothetical protein